MIASEGYEYDYEERSDSFEEDAVNRLTKFFKKFKNSVFDTKQLQVLFESHYFHWVTYRALTQLEKSKIIRIDHQRRGQAIADIRYHRSNRYSKRKIVRLMELIKTYSDQRISDACGQEANNLFQLALLERNFSYVAKETREYKQKKWTKTQHDLDLILTKGENAFGIEIKNSFDYIDREEMEIKIELCDHLGIIPVFIVRSAPKSYIETVREAGGFTLVYEAKIFPRALRDLAERINAEKFTPYLNDPSVVRNGRIRKLCDAPKSIPSGIIDRFANWAQNV
jgi:hypothetical protein